MANFIPSKKTAQDFNNGVQYIDEADSVQAETINDLIESALYSQEQADSAKQTAQGALSEVNQVLADKTLLPDVQKNYYNLDVYDTFVSNGNGTGIVTIKTKTPKFEDFEYNKFGSLGDGYWLSIPTTNFKANISIPFRSAFDAANTHYYIEGGNTNIIIASADISSLVLKYEAPPTEWYSYNVIENSPVHTLPQAGEGFIKNEWVKTLNLFSAEKSVGTSYGASFIVLNDNQIQVNQGESSFSRVRFSAEMLKGQTYYFSATSNSLTRVVIIDTVNDEIIKDVSNTSFGFSFVASENIEIWLYSSTTSQTVFSNIMLNEGSHPYPYEPYYGGIVREKDLSGIQLFPANVNPAQTIGGDWEDLGTVPVGTTTLHAYRRI